MGNTSVIMGFPSSIKTSEPSDRGNLDVYGFEIVDSNQERALRELLNWLEPNQKIFLSDHRRGDSEGGVIVELKDGELQFMRGGHGYSSEWFSSPKDEALREMLEAAKATKWGALLGNGSISIYKNTIQANELRVFGAGRSKATPVIEAYSKK